MARLGDVASYINGYAFKPSDWSTEGSPIIRIQDLTGNSYQMNRFEGDIDSRYEVLDGDILISWSASLGVYIWHGERAFLNQHIFKVILDESKVLKSFFFHQVEHILANADTLAHGATMKHLTRPVFDALPFYLPDLPTQRRIASTLDAITALIAKRHQQLDALDQLVKSRFVEMFGDIKTNEHMWNKCHFGDVTTKITDGEHGTVPRVNSGEGYLYFMARNITKNGTVDLTETSYVPEEVHQKIYKRCNPEVNDILLVCVGATIGKSALVTADLGEFSMARSVALLKPDKTKVNSIFLLNLLKSETIQNDIADCSHAAAQAGLYTNMIIDLDAFVPPIELQNKFAAFVAEVDKSKLSVQQSLQSLETLKKSLMQQYFG